ncbi:hypothetical protein PR003_g8973 [Phytophthora rubi]|uniref:C2 domain-containing protein n=1 Tax=Phytophthora rubi TaxID=129364 RepID=A0A6A3MS08_9STRA|nr:hypothetical protein PR002_g8285 [Phytophthora rubi]KAE9037800.1 hypothetical protein PR001_g8236 [Phytophthora rubi]KAE9343461.1 hypothetical protein PR003_g8973 [Phytophthora rubi]
MSSLHEPLALQREEPTTASHHRNARPFTASDARGGPLLTVLVHFGRHLEALVPGVALTELDGGERLNTYVVASVDASPDLVQGADSIPPVSASTSSCTEGRVLYEQRCSPYASTRVVEGAAWPSWNEVLAIPLPAGWSEPSPAKRQRPDQAEPTEAAAAEADAVVVAPESRHLSLKLELVQRGASHQEDFLLATCVLPLVSLLECQLQQTRFALAFPPVDSPLASSNQIPTACLYVSLHVSPRHQVSSLEQVEIMVESLTPVVVTGSEDEGLPPDCTSLATVINLHAHAGINSPLFEKLEDHFTLLRDGQSLAAPNSVTINANLMLGVTPWSSSTTGSASGVYEWSFPLNFAVPVESNQDTSAAAVNITLFKTSTVPHKLIGRGQLNLSSAPVTKDGSPLRHTVIPVELQADSSRVLGHIALRLRWWSAAAWKAFVDDTAARRVICTNRWKRLPRPTPAWMGALLRGLNRHPVASICDSGGVSSVLAELLADSSSNGESKQSPEQVSMQAQQLPHLDPTTQNCSTESAETNALLREQLAHLQAEGTSQRLQIERLQNELDTRLAAIKTCGLEIVALRRAARLKDEHLQKLKEQVEDSQRREQQQLAELLASTNGNGSVFPMQAASQHFSLLASKYKELDQAYQTVKQQLANAHHSLDSYAALETRHAKLQEAHLVQAALVQRLQRDKQHATALKKAVRMQEKVIRQFEQTVTQQSAEMPERSPPLQHATGVEPQATDSGGSETREALLRVRVQVLEQQLQTNAREAAAEMSALRMRILELETAESRHTGK